MREAHHRPLILKVATLALALGVLGFVVANAALSSSCAKPGQTTATVTNQVAPDGASMRYLPATKSGRVVVPREVQGSGTGNAEPRPPPPRFFPATKAAPVLLPGEVGNAPNVRRPRPQAPAQQAPQPQQAVPPGNE